MKIRLRFRLLILSVLFINISLSAQSKKSIKVACIGNSITYGSGIKDRIRDSYPAQLGRMLGSGYDVRNYGFSGRTMLLKGNHPYMDVDEFFAALAWQPDIVIIKLGTNDSKPQNWKFKNEFLNDYGKMVVSFDTLSSHPKIYVVEAVPVFNSRWGISDEIVKNEINPLIRKIAVEKNLHLIDLYTPFTDKGRLFPDHIHPNAAGAGEMAKIIYKHLTGHSGELVRQEFPGSRSSWKGFEKYSFDFYGRPAHFIRPAKALPGNPWVWRARFPNWHTEMDSILLSDGYHIAFVNTNNMLGSPKAMRIWDRYYNYLVKVQNFNPKLSLEGVSRGGLFIYNWAKRHPERIIAIYGEAPVCDFKSWPGGFGTGKGSESCWQDVLKEYGFNSSREAKDYLDNPIDNLADLAKAHVPVLHMIGLNDRVVPAQENTFVLMQRYLKLGGIVKVIPCTKGKQDIWGHHFVIETPRIGADFIEYYTKLSEPGLNTAAYHKLRSGLNNSLLKFKNLKNGRVAFIGGSITAMKGWRDSMIVYIKNRFPETDIEFISAGIPSMGSTCNAFRLDRDILMNGPVDLIFVEAAVNDPLKGRTDTQEIRAMEGLVRHLRDADPAVDIVFMYFVDPGKMATYRKGEIPVVIQNHDRVACYYNIPALDLAKEVTERIDAGEFTWKDDFKNLHPSPFGQGIYARSMTAFLREAWDGISPDAEVNGYPLPEKLDEFCYDKGVLLPARSIKPAKGWQFVEKWVPEIKARTRNNYVNVPMLCGSYPAKPLAIKFTGSTVGIAVAAGPDAGIIEFRIDKGKWKKQDLFTRHSSGYHLPWYFTLADGLKTGKHVLQIRLAAERNKKSVGSVCRIRYFYFNRD